LTESFSLERVGKSGSKFDPQKAIWFNHQYLLKKDTQQIASQFVDIIQEKGFDKDAATLERIVGMVKDRVNFVHEIWDQASFFFEAPDQYDEKIVKKKWKADTPEILNQLIPVLEEIENFTAPKLDEALHNYMEKNEVGAGKLMTALRIAMVGAGKGPDLKEIMEILGKEEVISRIRKANEIVG